MKNKRIFGFTLAEGTTCVDMSGNNRAFGFTLSEVLITLAIIGVVAALTMPSLIQNYQKKVLASQLKKSYSLWSQVFEKILADEGIEKLSDSKVFGIEYLTFNDGSKMILHSNFNPEELQKYVDIVISDNETQYYTNSSQIEYKEGVSGAEGRLIKAKDGSMVRQIGLWGNCRSKDTCDKIKELGGTFCSSLGKFVIDINGYKKPNIEGIDIFSFELSEDGKLYPFDGKDQALYYNQTELSSNNQYWKTRNACNPQQKPSPGSGCAARIMENGWVMDY